MKSQKWRELLDEFRKVFSGRNSFLDAILPPIIFLLVNGLIGFQAAMGSALAVSVVFAIARIIRKQSLWYALAGVGSVAVAVGIAWFLGKSEGFFLPGLISGCMTLLLTVLSLIIRRPMVAWTSYLARRWPLDWYWHAQVRPAYSEVTFFWALFFGARLFLQFSLFQNENVNSLAITNFITGLASNNPFIGIQLSLRHMAACEAKRPSVDEFRRNTPAPWQGQRRGF